MRAGIAVPNFGGNRIRPLIAIRALRALARSRGKDVAQGVIFLHATQGRSGQRGFCRLRASPAGQALLRERPAARDSLADRGRLAALPTGTLGRAYADFMTENKLDLRALADLEALGGERPMSPDERWFIDRATDLHDLWHVVIGYGTDELGELCVLAFRYAQTRHPGRGFLAFTWMFKLARQFPGRPVRAAVIEAYRRGRHAAWLEDVFWERSLEHGLDGLRETLRLAPPRLYHRVMADR